MAKAQTCIYCGARATVWCDLVIGFNNANGELATLDTEVFRCDAPLCEAHAAHKGTIFFSGSPEVAGAETIDHCCDHEEHWREDILKEWHKDAERWEPIDADEAQRRRYRHRCLAAGPLKALSNPQRSLFAFATNPPPRLIR
jgi:hypothetical protein